MEEVKKEGKVRPAFKHLHIRNDSLGVRTELSRQHPGSIAKFPHF